MGNSTPACTQMHLYIKMSSCPCAEKQSSEYKKHLRSKNKHAAVRDGFRLLSARYSNRPTDLLHRLQLTRALGRDDMVTLLTRPLPRLSRFYSDYARGLGFTDGSQIFKHSTTWQQAILATIFGRSLDCTLRTSTRSYN